MLPFNNLLLSQKNEINSRIDLHFKKYQNEFGKIGASSPEAIERLFEFAKGGKGVRGGLFMLSTSLFNFTNKEIILDVAVSLEILQASLLIHDDIMDNDLLRRGKPSLFAQYIPNGKELKASSPEEYGKSMAICIGDVGFFIAIDICNKALTKHDRKDAIMHLLYKELIIVGLAQMDDVTFGASQNIPTINEILRMYLYKTAHYTFSLPLSLGSLVSGLSPNIITQMEQLGEEIGLLFQIKDDEIGLYTKESVSGKLPGSDIRENKKTLFRLILEKKISKEERKQLSLLQYQRDLNEIDISKYLQIIEKYHVRKDIQQLISTHKSKAEQILHSLDIPDEKKVPLRNLIEFVVQRSS